MSFGAAFTGVTEATAPAVVPVLGAKEGTQVDTVDSKVVLGSDQDLVADDSSFTVDRYLLLDGHKFLLTANEANFPFNGGFRTIFEFDPFLGTFFQIVDSSNFSDSIIGFRDPVTGGYFKMTFNSQNQIIIESFDGSGFQNFFTMSNGSQTFNTTAPYLTGIYTFQNCGMLRKRQILAKTANFVFNSQDSDTLWTNEGAGALVTGTCLATSPGDIFRGYVDNVNGLAFKAPAGVTIEFAGTVTAPGGTVTSVTAGDTIVLECISATKLVATSIFGTWF